MRDTFGGVGALLDIAKTASDRLGVRDQASTIYRQRNRLARRDYRDDRNLFVLMSSHITPSTNCIDVGANIGEMSDRIVELAPEGAHLFVEPVPHLAEQLRERLPAGAVHEVALSDHEGTETFWIGENPALSGFKKRPWHDYVDYVETTVRVAQLDSLAKPGVRYGFLKIDAEGAHVLVLKGARRVLEDRPVIWLDHGAGSAELYGTSSEELWALLSEYDYRLFDADGNGPMTWTEFKATDDNPSRWTFLAVAG